MTKSRFFRTAACITCVLLGQAISVKAQFAGGDGSSEDPYQIATAAQLAQLATFVNAGDINYNDKQYILIENIDLSVYDSNNITFNNGKGWIPIGDYSNFLGVFDGNSKKITGLYINNTLLGYGVGLFGTIENSTVKNLGVENVDITYSPFWTSSHVGGIVGYIYYGGNVSHCYSTGVITSSTGNSSYAGGIAGHNFGTVSNCYSTATVNSSSSHYDCYAGGVVAINYFFTANVLNCYSIGAVNSYISLGYSYAGGVVGNNRGYNGANVSNCAALNTSIFCSGYITGYGRVVGRNGESTNNIAFDNMLNPSGTTTWSNIGLDQIDGEDISATDIYMDSTLGNRFTSANGWTTKKGKLPGLFGEVVDMPPHLLPPTITTAVLPNTTIGTAYNKTVTANGASPITWSLYSGNLPDGLNLTTNGTISGTPTTEGMFTFTVMATNYVGNDTAEFSITVVDKTVEIIEMRHATPNINVYPNPTTGQIRIANYELKVETINIIDVLGRTVLTKHALPTNDIIEIDVSHLPMGMYYLRITGEKNTTVKFVKSNE